MLLPVLVSNAIAAGPSRILFLYLDSANKVASAPDRTLKAAFYDLDKDPTKPVVAADGTFMWTIEGERGMYAVNVALPAAGPVGRGADHRGARIAGRDDPAVVRRPRVDADRGRRAEGTRLEDADARRRRR